VTGDEDPGFTALDAYLCAQLARAAETHASHTDLSARLLAARTVDRNDDHGGAAATDS